ncbi:hypothetical protein BV22DRAFT_1194612 [Leucogyrophana mollusca]|uniref:Uncharacterized protein n=1 Tax=Leucogyrophana mollusca TaxID=85980 RepID=A0ACB8BNL4_9AGAM|nr:hypothetical protein BV22DRAFT_1194612 [Leucogyrophana mollusca]
MGATKSQKAAKYTYAERVLGAYSQAQKEHRRQIVHMATLRAQVRKIAQTKKDKLGPQWSSWVTKAVHKLEEQGLLQHEDSSGYVSMTPEGRKVLSIARKRLHAAPGGAASPLQEDAVWKSVAEQFSPHGQKRKIGSRLRPLADRGDASDAEEDQSASVRGSPRKRPRRSIAVSFTSPQKSPQKPVSKMTKAELKAELKALQQATLQTSRTSGISQIEAQRLRRDLADREKQLQTATHELNSTRRSIPAVDDQEMMTEPDDEFQRPASPVYSDRLTPLPESPLPVDMLPSQPSFGVTRTQSGSVIPHVSQRPTPAPSSPGVDNGHYGDEDDVFTEDRDGRRAGDVNAGSPRQVATPESSPDRSPARKSRDLEQEVQVYKTRLENANRESQETENALQEKITALESKVSEQASHITGLQEEIQSLENVVSEHQLTIQQLTIKNTTLTGSLANQDALVTELQELVASRKDELDTVAQDKLDLAMRLSSVEQDARQAEEAKERLRGDLESAHVDKERLSSSLDESRTHMAAERAGFETQKLEFETLLTELRGGLNMSQEQTAELEKKTAGLEHELDAARVRVMELEESSATLAADLAHSKETAERLTAKLDDAQALQSGTEVMLGEARGTIQDMRQRIDGMVVQTAQLETELQQTISQAHSHRTGLEDEIAELRSGNLSLKRRADGLSHDLDAARLGMTDLQASVDAMKTQHEEDERISAENASFAQAALQAAQLAAGQLRAELEDCRAELRTENITAMGLRTDLADVHQRLGEMEEEMISLKAAKRADEGTIEALKLGYQGLRQAQMDALAKMEGQIASAQSSPIPTRVRGRVPAAGPA